MAVRAGAHPWDGVAPFKIHYSIAFKHPSVTGRLPLGEILYPPLCNPSAHRTSIMCFYLPLITAVKRHLPTHRLRSGQGPLPRMSSPSPRTCPPFYSCYSSVPHPLPPTGAGGVPTWLTLAVISVGRTVDTAAAVMTAGVRRNHVATDADVILTVSTCERRVFSR